MGVGIGNGIGIGLGIFHRGKWGMRMVRGREEERKQPRNDMASGGAEWSAIPGCGTAQAIR